MKFSTKEQGSLAFDRYIKIKSEPNYREMTKAAHLALLEEYARKVSQRNQLYTEISQLQTKKAEVNRIRENLRETLHQFNMQQRKVEEPYQLTPTQAQIDEEKERRRKDTAESYDNQYALQEITGGMSKSSEKYFEELYTNYISEYKKTEEGQNHRPPLPDTWDEYNKLLSPKQGDITIKTKQEQLSRLSDYYQPESMASYMSEIDRSITIAAAVSANKDYEIIFEKEDFTATGELKKEVRDELINNKVNEDHIKTQENAYRTLRKITTECNTSKKGLTSEQYNFITRIRSNAEFYSGDPSKIVGDIQKIMHEFPKDKMSTKFSTFINKVGTYCSTFLSEFTTKGVSRAQASAKAMEKVAEIKTPSQIFKEKIEKEAVVEPTSYKPPSV